MPRYDLHVHTAERSACAVSRASDMCRAALEKGLSGIALTDHDTWWPAGEIERLRALFPSLVILSGAEVALEEGHFLVFAPAGPPRLPFTGDLEDLAGQVHEAGGVVIWAHPFRYDPVLPDWFGRVRLDGMEVDSSNMNGPSSDKAATLAAKASITPFRNSDAHHTDTVGRYWNELDRPLRDEAGLVRLLAREFR
jgi:predicted metal-dependent phosphoesterase TrpH